MSEAPIASSGAVAAARAALDAEPSEATARAVVEAEEAERVAGELRAARARAAERAAETEREARQVAARERRLELAARRQPETFDELNACIADIGAVYERLNAIIERIDVAVQRDVELCRAHNEMSELAAERAYLEPIDLELIRLAIGIELAKVWNDEPEGIGEADLVDALAAIGRFGTEPSTPLEFHRRLELTQMEVEHAFGSAPLHRWLATIAPVAWTDHSPAASRCRRALTLLQHLRRPT